jgi:hypothetical protein
MGRCDGRYGAYLAVFDRKTAGRSRNTKWAQRQGRTGLLVKSLVTEVTSGARMTDERQGADRPEWQRPPFEDGNLAAMTHGATSPRKVAELFPEVRAEIERAIRSLWVADVDQLAVERCAWTVSQLRLLERYLSDHGGLSRPNGKPNGAWALYVQLEGRIEGWLTVLGLTPDSRNRLLGRPTVEPADDGPMTFTLTLSRTVSTRCRR